MMKIVSTFEGGAIAGSWTSKSELQNKCKGVVDFKSSAGVCFSEKYVGSGKRRFSGSENTLRLGVCHWENSTNSDTARTSRYKR